MPGKTTEQEAAAMNRSRQGGVPYAAGPHSIALQILSSELPHSIETELFWQAAQRDWDRERLDRLRVHFEYDFDNREVLYLGNAEDTAAFFERTGITLSSVQGAYVHQRMASEYLSRIRTDSIDAQSAIKKAAVEEWNKANIQTAFDLPVRK